MRPYRLPLEKVTEISSKSGLEPYCMAMLVVEIKDVLLGFAIDGIHFEWDSAQSFKHGLKNPVNIDRVFPVIRVRLELTANGLKGHCSTS